MCRHWEYQHSQASALWLVWCDYTKYPGNPSFCTSPSQIVHFLRSWVRMGSLQLRAALPMGSSPGGHQCYLVFNAKSEMESYPQLLFIAGNSSGWSVLPLRLHPLHCSTSIESVAKIPGNANLCDESQPSAMKQWVDPKFCIPPR